MAREHRGLVVGKANRGCMVHQTLRIHAELERPLVDSAAAHAEATAAIRTRDPRKARWGRRFRLPTDLLQLPARFL